MYSDMCKILSEGKLGDFELNKFTIRPDNLMAHIQGIDPGTYVRLRHNGSCVMSNTDMEMRTNREFVDKAYGDVLIGGLGIGMVLLAIQDKESVDSITVLEMHKDVIELVGSQLPLNNKVHIIEADAFTWTPNMRFDCIYMDIWNYINTDVYEEMKQLKRRYGHYLKSAADSPNRFNMCWAEWEAKHGSRL